MNLADGTSSPQERIVGVPKEGPSQPTSGFEEVWEQLSGYLNDSTFTGQTIGNDLVLDDFLAWRD